MAGGWASALGAAILGGNQGYQEGTLNQQKNLMAAIQLKLAQDQLAELPKKHAESDVDRQMVRDGVAAFNDPNFVRNNAAAGQPLQTNTGPLPLSMAKNLDGSPIDVNKTAEQLGVAPLTGAVIPPDLQVKARQQKQAMTQADAITQFMQQQLGADKPASAPTSVSPVSLAPIAGGDDSTFPNGVKQYVVKLKQTYPGDSAGARAELQRAWPDLVKDHPNLDPNKVLSNFPAQAEGPPNLGQVLPSLGAEPPWEDPAIKRQRLMGKLTGIDTAEPPHESTVHKVYDTTAESVAKAAFKPPAQAIQKELDAYKKARILIPQLRDALMGEVIDKNDPTGQNAGMLRMGAHMAGQNVKAAAYGAGYPLSDNAAKAQQLAGLMKVVGATPYMNGSRSMQMFNQVADHLTDRHMTPEAQIQRLNELEQIFPEFEKMVGFVPGEVKGKTAQEVAPQQGASNTPAIPANGASNPQTVNKNRSLAEVNALASQTRQTPKSIIDQIHAAGGTVDGK